MLKVSLIVFLLMSLFQASTLMADWRADAEARIEKHRKGDFTLTIEHAESSGAAGKTVTIEQVSSTFHFGVAVAEKRLATRHTDPESRKYAETIRDNFNTLVCENAMKWYATEKEAGKLTYDGADEVVKFAAENNQSLRGHCLFWAKRKFIESQKWLVDLDGDALRTAIDRRLNDIVPRYKGKVFCWDVNNEMLDGDHYEKALGFDINAHMFRKARELDPKALLFVNEYAILGQDDKTARYIKLIEKLKAAGAPVTGIGIQEHAAERFAIDTRAEGDTVERAGVAQLDPAASIKRLDKLAALKLPIHLTEISFKTKDRQKQAEALDTFFTMGFSHPSVECILLWGFWEKAHWLGAEAALMDKNFKPYPAFERYREIVFKRWRTNTTLIADSSGAVNFRGFLGRYRVTITNPQNGAVAVGYVDLNASGRQSVKLVIK